MNPKKIISAQVILASKSGRHPGPKTQVTSRNVEEWLPSADAIATVSEKLREMGFEVGNCVGNSLSITGAVQLFESAFQTTIHGDSAGAKFGRTSDELAANKIPPALQGSVAEITFTPPPDFGPGTKDESFG
jgi:hypothetical protein